MKQLIVPVPDTEEPETIFDAMVGEWGYNPLTHIHPNPPLRGQVEPETDDDPTLQLPV